MQWNTTPKQPAERSAQLLMLLCAAANSESLTQALYGQFLESPICDSQCNTQLLRLASSEDKLHFEAIDECIHRLDKSGKQLANAKPMSNSNWQSPLAEQHLLTTLGSIEARSVQLYTQICALSMEFDYKIFDISYRNMHNNMLHMNTLQAMHRNRKTIESKPRVLA